MFRHSKGFSLIEVIVAVAIMGVLLALGVPQLATYSRNVKIRAAAESFLAAAQTARSEAVRLNSRVELILTNSAPVPDDGTDSDFPVLAQEFQNNLGATEATGLVAANRPVAKAGTDADRSYNWVARTLPSSGGACGANPGPDPGQQGKACWFLGGRRGAEGAGGSVSDADSPVLIVGPAAVVFGPLGRADAAVQYDFSAASGQDCALAGGPIRCLRVRVEAGGRAKLCDPAATAVGDTRGC